MPSELAHSFLRPFLEPAGRYLAQPRHVSFWEPPSSVWPIRRYPSLSCETVAQRFSGFGSFVCPPFALVTRIICFSRAFHRGAEVPGLVDYAVSILAAKSRPHSRMDVSLILKFLNFAGHLHGERIDELDVVENLQVCDTALAEASDVVLAADGTFFQLDRGSHLLIDGGTMPTPPRSPLGSCHSLDDCVAVPE